VRVHRVDIPLLRPFVTAVRTATELSIMLVEVVDSDGRSGWGEAPASWRVTGESPESIRAVVEDPLAATVVGREVGDLPDLIRDVTRAVFANASARSAVDCALHDLASQQAGIPLHTFLGGTLDSVRTDMTLSAGNAESLVASAAEWMGAGFSTIKIKVGTGPDDLDAVRRVRETVGPDIRLRVDANQAWTADEAVEIIAAWERLGLGIEFVEQPVAARAIDDLAFVSSHTSTPILADESAWTSRDLIEIAKRRAADLVNIKLAKTGGIGEARVMLETAKASGMGVLVGCMMESVVGVSAAASLATLVPGTTHDLDAGLWQTRSPVIGGGRYRGELIELSTMPGIGIEGIS
jgi:L-alanine-DL-glutamate epimerase-like enolase superfamily enzyme